MIAIGALFSLAGCGEAGSSRLSAQLPPTPSPCCGDCNGDGSVTVNELVTGVNRALDGCPAPSVDYCGQPQVVTIALPHTLGCAAAQGQLLIPSTVEVLHWEPVGVGCSPLINPASGAWSWMCGKNQEENSVPLFVIRFRQTVPSSLLLRVDLAVNNGCNADLTECTSALADCGGAGSDEILLACTPP